MQLPSCAFWLIVVTISVGSGRSRCAGCIGCCARLWPAAAHVCRPGRTLVTTIKPTTVVDRTRKELALELLADVRRLEERLTRPVAVSRLWCAPPTRH